MASPTAKRTLKLFNQNGQYVIPVDSRYGDLYRPQAVGEPGARLSGLETLYDFWIDNVWDPDEALKLDPSIRQKLRMHPDVQAAFRKRQLTVANFSDRIEPNPLAEDQEAARKIAKEIEWAYSQLPRHHLLYSHLQNAVLDGGTGVEFVWQREASGTERPVNWFGIDKTRFIRDRIGNLALLTRQDPVWGANIAPSPLETLPTGILKLDKLTGKFMYYVYRQQVGGWDQPDIEGYVYWGIGEDVALYYPVTFDIFVLKGRMKWLEQYGNPAFDLYYPQSNNPADLAQAQKIAAATRNLSVVSIPKIMGTKSLEENSWYLKQRDVPSPSYDAWSSFSDTWTKRRIDGIILGSADETQKGQTGSFADHVSRRDSGPQIIFTYDAMNISESITSQLIVPMTLARFPQLPAEYWPHLVLEGKEERDRLQEVEIIDKASALLDISEDEAYERLGFKRPNTGDKIVKKKMDTPETPQGKSEGKPRKPIGEATKSNGVKRF